MKPINNFILIQVEEESIKNGLYVPKTSCMTGSEILKKGTVVDVSPELYTDIEPNDIVYYNKNAITKIPDSSDLILVRKVDIYAVEYTK